MHGPLLAFAFLVILKSLHVSNFWQYKKNICHCCHRLSPSPIAITCCLSTFAIAHCSCPLLSSLNVLPPLLPIAPLLPTLLPTFLLPSVHRCCRHHCAIAAPVAPPSLPTLPLPSLLSLPSPSLPGVAAVPAAVPATAINAVPSLLSLTSPPSLPSAPLLPSPPLRLSN